jgi:hypothetical protein
MNFYEQSAQDSGFEIGVRTALQSILANPSFLFRLEEQPEDALPGQLYQLNESDLAGLGVKFGVAGLIFLGVWSFVVGAGLATLRM